MVPEESPDISVCIVSWNVWEDLERCLESLQGGGAVEAEIIVVDNGSRDETLRELPRRFPSVKLIANESNRGFAGGCNQGMEAAEGRYLFLLNPDTIVPPGALEELVRFADRHREAGIVGPKLLNADGSLQYSCRRFPTIAAGMLRHTLLGRLFPHARSVSSYLMEDWDHREVREVDWVSGAAMLIRREMYEESGALDEGFFWGSEDVDYCWRAHKAGWGVVYTPSPAIVHLIGSSTDQALARTVVRTHRSMYRLYSKHVAKSWLSRLLVGVGIVLRAGLVMLSTLRGPQRNKGKLEEPGS